MKIYVKLFMLALSTAVVLFSCDVLEKEKGGTINVTNGDTRGALITVVKGVDWKSPEETDVVGAGQTKTFSFAEDGFYTATASFISNLISIPKYKTVYLSGGETRQITLTPND
jgi:hypothetical protein